MVDLKNYFRAFLKLGNKWSCKVYLMGGWCFKYNFINIMHTWAKQSCKTCYYKWHVII